MSKYVGLKTLILQGLSEPEFYADFARISSYLTDFNAQNNFLTAKLLQQGNRFYRLRKTFFSTFYRRHFEFGFLNIIPD